ncbi:MAG: type 4a pilus biogenesis protein PilO [Desulfomicrobium sp.]
MDKSSVSKKFAELSSVQLLLILLGLAALVYGAYWYFILDDKLVQITKARQNIEKLDKDIALYRAQVAKLPELERSLAAKNKELYYAKTLLPEDSRALEMLLSSFEKLGRDENVEFILFQPGAEQIQEFYATRSVQLQISGTFHRLVTYFDRLTRLDRLVTIQNVTFSPVSDFSPTEKYLNTSLVLQVYRALTEAEIAAREAQKKQSKKK